MTQSDPLRPKTGSFMLCPNFVLIEIEEKLSREVRNGYGEKEEPIACILFKLDEGNCVKR